MLGASKRGDLFLDQEDLYRLAFEKCETGLILLSAGGVVLAANARACAMLDASVEEITGRGIEEVLGRRASGGLPGDGLWFDLSPAGESGVGILSLHAGPSRGAEIADLFLEALGASPGVDGAPERGLRFRSAATRHLLEFVCGAVPADRAAICACEDGRLRVLAEVRRGEGGAAPRPEPGRVAALGTEDVLVEKNGSGVAIYAPLAGSGGKVLEVAGGSALGSEGSVAGVRAISAWLGVLVSRGFEGRYLDGDDPLIERAAAGILLAQEEERRKIAYEIHGYIIQRATALSRRLQTLARRRAPQTELEERSFRRMREIIDEMIDTGRNLIEDLRPPLLEDFGLAPALRRLVERMREDGREIYYREAIDEERLAGHAEVALFRVAQEALYNVEKHAGETPVFVELRVEDGRARLDVRDFGRGFEEVRRDGPGGVGIPAMRERVELAGGVLEIESSPGEGTLVRARIPTHRGDEDGL